MLGRHPKARTEGLLVRDLGDEVVLYEIDTHRARCSCVGQPNFTQCSYGPQANCASDVCCGSSCCDACPGGVQQLPCN